MNLLAIYCGVIVLSLIHLSAMSIAAERLLPPPASGPADASAASNVVTQREIERRKDLLMRTLDRYEMIVGTLGITPDQKGRFDSRAEYRRKQAALLCDKLERGVVQNADGGALLRAIGARSDLADLFTKDQGKLLEDRLQRWDHGEPPGVILFFFFTRCELRRLKLSADEYAELDAVMRKYETRWMEEVSRFVKGEIDQHALDGRGKRMIVDAKKEMAASGAIDVWRAAVVFDAVKQQVLPLAGFPPSTNRASAFVVSSDPEETAEFILAAGAIKLRSLHRIAENMELGPQASASLQRSRQLLTILADQVRDSAMPVDDWDEEFARITSVITSEPGLSGEQRRTLHDIWDTVANANNAALWRYATVGDLYDCYGHQFKQVAAPERRAAVDAVVQAAAQKYADTIERIRTRETKEPGLSDRQTKAMLQILIGRLEQDVKKVLTEEEWQRYEMLPMPVKTGRG